MVQISLDNHIDVLEERFDLLAAAVVDGSPEVLQSVSADFQLLTVELLQMLNAGGRDQMGISDSASRVRSLAAGLSTVREGLLRQAAYVDRALELIVPGMQKKATYPGSNNAYGAPALQSGAFAVLTG
jgi:hypothetical protein